MAGARVEKKLTSVRVKALREPGKYEDGGGLRIVVDPTGARRWVMRVSIDGKRIERGLGPFPTVSLEAARVKADEIRSAAKNGVDVRVEERKRELAGTSLTATAIRYAELTRAAAVIIVSTGQRIDYCRLSDSIKELKGVQWVRKGSAVPADTITAHFNSVPDLVARSERRTADIDIRSWLGGERRVAAVEEVIGLGSYGRTLTVLTCPGVEEQAYGYDDGDEEERMIDSWTPKFRR